MLVRICFILTCMLLLGGESFAQKVDRRAEVRETFWGSKDKYKKATDIPEKWNDESAVIICQELIIEYKRKSAKIKIFSEAIRRRIKLLDKSAVEDHSEFSLTDDFKDKPKTFAKGGGTIMELKVIKPDGSERTVDLENAVAVDASGSGKAQKVAVPGLEPGDILDYYYYFYDPEYDIGFKAYEGEMATLSASYPIMTQKIKFIVDKDYYFNFRSYNDAPALQLKSSEDKKVNIYEMVDSDRKRKKKPRWYYPAREEPMIKYQVIYQPQMKYVKDSYLFYGTEGIVQKEIKLNDIISRMKTKDSFRSFTKVEKGRLEDAGLDPKDKKTFLRKAYDLQRFNRITSKMEMVILSQENIKSDFYGVGSFPSELDMISYMGNLCLTYDIDFDILLVASRSVSDVKDVIFYSEMEWILRINLDEPVYVSSWYLFSEFGLLPRYLEGSEAVSVAVNKDGDLTSGKLITLPVSSHEENRTEKIINYDLTDLTAETRAVDREVKVTGLAKSYYQSDLLIPEDYLEQEYVYFQREANMGTVRIGKKEAAKIKLKYDRYKEDKRKEQEKSFETYLKDDFNFEIEEYKDFKLSANGRLDQSAFEYTEEFTLGNDLIKKAGKNYLFSLGELTGGQVAIKEDEKEREENIYMPYARSFKYELNIKLPEGYSVEGLEKFNLDVSNETGGFKSSYDLQGTDLKVISEKWYANNFEPNENWPKMIEFLDAAFQFSQEKILLKKL